MALFDSVIHGSGDSACADHALGNLGAGSSAPLPLGESVAGSVTGGSERCVSACLDAPDRDGAEPQHQPRGKTGTQVVTLAGSCFCPGSARGRTAHEWGTRDPVIQADSTW